MNINDLVLESLLDKKIEALSNQGKHLDQLMPGHRHVAHHITNMVHQHMAQQSQEPDPQQMMQPDPQQMMQPDPQQMMQPVMMPPKPNRKINKLIKTLDATRDHLLNLHQRLV